MTTAEIKAKLMRARVAERDYRLARDKTNAYRQLIACGKAVRYGSDGSTHERKGNPVENAYCCLADYSAEEERLLQELISVRHRAEKLIAFVPDQAQREVLTRRYIIGQRWEDIAVCMNYSLRRIYQLHGYALQNIALNCTIFL